MDFSPIYIAEYPHEKEPCYKIDLPYPKFSRDTIVLCKVSEGQQKAIRLAKEAVEKHLKEVFSYPIETTIRGCDNEKRSSLCETLKK